jgi:hypothetical protein
MVTDAGLLIVDGVMVTANFANDGNYNVFSSWYKFTPVWQAYLEGNSSGCSVGSTSSSSSCPCLDGKTPVCTREGDSLVSLGTSGLSWFRQQLQDVSDGFGADFFYSSMSKGLLALFVYSPFLPKSVIKEAAHSRQEVQDGPTFVRH